MQQGVEKCRKHHGKAEGNCVMGHCTIVYMEPIEDYGKTKSQKFQGSWEGEDRKL